MMEEPDNNDGNFRAILRFRAMNGDDLLKEHLLNSGGNAMYTSSCIQNELIIIFGELIQEQIVKQVYNSDFYSIIADETTDIAQIEQLSLCVRYVDEKTMLTKEDFLGFVPVKDLTGAGLTSTILETLIKLGLDLSKLRGQGYDGASNMRGEFRGVQALVKEKFPKALYTHCVSHSLNLCVSDSTKIQGIRNAFGVISEVCNFFHRSAKQSTILADKIKELKPKAKQTKLKTLCETRWVARHDAVLMFKEFIEPIIAALEQIESLATDDSSKKAHILLQSVCHFPFLISVCVASKLLGYTVNLSEYLQSSHIDLAHALDEVSAIHSMLQEVREDNESKFQSLFEEAEKLAESNDIEVITPRVCRKQKNRPNIVHKTTQDYYRVTLFLPYLDDLMSSLTERFLPHRLTIRALSNLIPKNTIEKNFEDIQEAISFYEDDINTNQDALEAEWDLWKKKWMSAEILPCSAIGSLYECNKNIFPNIYILLKILSVLPVSAATAERSFSTLRRLKTYLRSTTNEHRLTGLALLNVHRQCNISDDSVINKFICKNRKLNLNL